MRLWLLIDAKTSRKRQVHSEGKASEKNTFNDPASWSKALYDSSEKQGACCCDNVQSSRQQQEKTAVSRNSHEALHGIPHGS